MHYHFLSNLSLPPYGDPELAELGEVNLLIAVLVCLLKLSQCWWLWCFGWKRLWPQWWWWCFLMITIMTTHRDNLTWRIKHVASPSVILPPTCAPNPHLDSNFKTGQAIFSLGPPILKLENNFHPALTSWRVQVYKSQNWKIQPPPFHIKFPPTFTALSNLCRQVQMFLQD